MAKLHSGHHHIPTNEFLYITPEGGPIQFIKGDRPQEFIGSEVCLVRNHRFKGLYFLRTNGLVAPTVLDLIAENIICEISIEDRNRVYCEEKKFLDEPTVGVTCGLFIDFTLEPYAISFSMRGLEVHSKAMLVFSSPAAMEFARSGLNNPALAELGAALDQHVASICSGHWYCLRLIHCRCC